MNKVLFMVPHSDDEMFVGGPLLVELVKSNKYDVFVFIATNSDYYPFENSIRVSESLTVLEEIGVKKENIIFGGYGDKWLGKFHIYNSSNDEIKISHSNYCFTHVNHSYYKDWHRSCLRKSHRYTRQGYFDDIKLLLLNIKPDVIICVDLDSHCDHRCLSLLTEEVLGFLLKKLIDYKPILLKKYAYQGVMRGKFDYFHYPHHRSFNNGNITSNPYLLWENRICYNVPKYCNTRFLINNYLYKLIKKYKSQDVWHYAPNFINSDIVYWLRNTNNLALLAKISASSGEVKWLNDFKLLDSDDILVKNCDYSSRCWRPNENDCFKEIKIELFKPSKIKYICLYFNNLKVVNGTCFIELFDSSKTLLINKKIIINKTGLFFEKIEVDTKIKVSYIKINFSITEGIIGLGEIEILDYILDIPFKEFLFTADKYQKHNFLFLNFALRLEEIYFRLKRLMHKYLKDKYEYRRIEYSNHIELNNSKK